MMTIQPSLTKLQYSTDSSFTTLSGVSSKPGGKPVQRHMEAQQAAWHYAIKKVALLLNSRDPTLPRVARPVYQEDLSASVIIVAFFSIVFVLRKLQIFPLINPVLMSQDEEARARARHTYFFVTKLTDGITASGLDQASDAHWGAAINPLDRIDADEEVQHDLDKERLQAIIYKLKNHAMDVKTREAMERKKDVLDAKVIWRASADTVINIGRDLLQSDVWAAVETAWLIPQDDHDQPRFVAGVNRNMHWTWRDTVPDLSPGEMDLKGTTPLEVWVDALLFARSLMIS
jgi:hypothetical protein